MVKRVPADIADIVYCGPLGILEIMFATTRSTVRKCLRQVQTHMGLQFQPHRPPVLSSRFHHRFFHSLLPQAGQQAVQLARHRHESPSPWILLWRARIHHNDHQYFLVYVNPRDLHCFLLAWKRQNAREKDYTPSRATTPTRRSGATQIGSKRAFLIKLKSGLTSSRVQTNFRRPGSVSVHAPTQPHFHVNGWVGPRPMHNFNAPQ